MGYSSRLYARKFASLIGLVVLLATSHAMAHQAKTHLSFVVQVDDAGIGILSRTAIARKSALGMLPEAHTITRQALSGLAMRWNKMPIGSWAIDARLEKSDPRSVHVEATALSIWKWPIMPQTGELLISILPKTPGVEIFVQALPPWQLTSTDLHGVKTVPLGLTAPVHMAPLETHRFQFTRGADDSHPLKRQTTGPGTSQGHGRSGSSVDEKTRP
jgi:hypothetical protein